MTMAMAVRQRRYALIMMRGLRVMRRGRQRHGSKRKRDDTQSKHPHLHVVVKETQVGTRVRTRQNWAGALGSEFSSTTIVTNALSFVRHPTHETTIKTI
jgi:hypothetical protein